MESNEQHRRIKSIHVLSPLPSFPSLIVPSVAPGDIDGPDYAREGLNRRQKLGEFDWGWGLDLPENRATSQRVLSSGLPTSDQPL